MVNDFDATIHLARAGYTDTNETVRSVAEATRAFRRRTSLNLSFDRAVNIGIGPAGFPLTQISLRFFETFEAALSAASSTLMRDSLPFSTFQVEIEQKVGRRSEALDLLKILRVCGQWPLPPTLKTKVYRRFREVETSGLRIASTAFLFSSGPICRPTRAPPA